VPIFKIDAVKLPVPPTQLQELIAAGRGGLVFDDVPVRSGARFVFARFDHSGSIVAVGYHTDQSKPMKTRRYLLVPINHEYEAVGDHFEPLDLVQHPLNFAAFALFDVTGPEEIYGS
jgi:hypothetical protein